MVAAETAKRWLLNIREARNKRSLYQRIRDFKRHVPLHYETDEFSVTTASHPSDLLRVLQLRHEVFVEEWQGRKLSHGLDVDHYDFEADHIIIRDKRSDQIVGTYRVLSSNFTDEFYSSSEFHISDFLVIPGVKLEMGRSCIHKDYRNGNTLDLLWKGLSQYIEQTETDYLFGCCSVKTIEPQLISALYQMLREEGSWTDDFQIRPMPDYRFADFLIATESELSAKNRRELMPPLLRSYLHAGAKTYGWPARDMEFRCTDVLTILDWKQLHPRFRARYLSKG